MKRLLITLTALILGALMLASIAGAYDIEGTIEKSMKDSLLSAGLDEITSLRIARQYMFIGTVMIGKTQLSTDSEGDMLFAQAEETGSALGRALAGTRLIYGNSKLEEIAWVMMKSTRAGIPAGTAADTFVTLAENSYTFDAAVSVLDRVAEVVRSMRMHDAGKALCHKIQSLADESVSVGEIENEILVSARNEKNKQAMILAKKEAERLKRDNAGGSDSRDGRDSSVASAGGNENTGSSSGRGNANDASSSASDNSAASDNSPSNDNSSANDNASANDSSAADDSASDSSSAGSDSSEANDSSNADSGTDDASNGDSSTEGDGAANSNTLL